MTRWPHIQLTPLCPIGYKSIVPEHLFIVAKDQHDLYRYLAREFATEPDVQVILDRRRGERRVGAEARATPHDDRRRAQRRVQKDVGTQISTLGYAFVRLNRSSAAAAARTQATRT
jgi:hypothetical protein